MRILVADDDDDVRECLVKMLQLEGHEVVAARHGLAAMQQYVKARRGDTPFDYVITDYQMPEKNGVVLIMEIRALDPQQKCILVSADPPTLDKFTKELTGEFVMLQKPYRSAALLALLV